MLGRASFVLSDFLSVKCSNANKRDASIKKHHAQESGKQEFAQTEVRCKI